MWIKYGSGSPLVPLKLSIVQTLDMSIFWLAIKAF